MVDVVIKNPVYCLVAALMLWTLSVCNASEISTKKVTLDEFMQSKVKGAINVPVFVLTDFEAANLPRANFGYSYWMNPTDVAANNENGDLPVENGFMYGKITPNVSYDAQRNIFIGLEDPKSIENAKRQMTSLTMERYKFGAYAIVLLKFSIENKPGYSMYVATNIGSNVVYIGLRPPRNSEEIGDQIWALLKGSLESVPKRSE